MRLECRTFAYDDDGAAPVLAELTLEVRAGEYVVVAGASGSGKTTLARLLAGQTGGDAGAAFEGSLTLGDQTLAFAGAPGDPRIDPAVWSAAVAYVAQGAEGQLSMMSATVGEEIAFGPSNRGVPAEQLIRSVDEVSAALGLTALLRRDPRRLSGGQLQRTIIAAAMVQRPQFLVLDEPFQGLDHAASADVAAALDALRAAGTGVVVCEPLLPGSAPAGARVLGLAGGRPVYEGLLTEALVAGLGNFGIGTVGDPPTLEFDGDGADDGVGDLASGRDDGGSGTEVESDGGERAGAQGGSTAVGDLAGSAAAGPRELVALRDVRFRYHSSPRRSSFRTSASGRGLLRRVGGPRAAERRAAERRIDVPRAAGRPDDDAPGEGLRNLDLTVRAGEIVAVTGPNGSGKSTVLQLLNGLLRVDGGSVTVDGTVIGRQPTGAFARSVGFLFQDTDQQLFERTVLREVSYGPVSTGAGKVAALQRASAALERVGLGGVGDVHPYELGFVQRRLVALASIIAVGAPVWVLDEPTAGLDAGTRDLLARLMVQHGRDGGVVVLATHDASFARTVASRIVRMADGRIEPVNPSDLHRPDLPPARHNP